MRYIAVTDFGPIGTSDDTETVKKAVACSTPGDAIFFPPGTYSLNNLVMERLNKRTLCGVGKESVLKQVSGSNWATIMECDDLEFRNLTLDANGVAETYGGVRMYGCRGPKVMYNTIYDSNPQKPGQTDRYSFTFSVGLRPTEEATVKYNDINHLQLEADFIKNSVISHNKLSNSVNTAGIGMFTVNNGISCENVEISDNIIVEGRGASIMVAVDPPHSNHAYYSDIRILRNKIYRHLQNGEAIRVGTGNVTVESMCNEFKDFAIEDNEIEYFGDAKTSDSALIWLIASSKSGLLFRNFSIKRNKLKVANLDNVAFNIRKLENSEVCDNEMEGFNACFAIGDKPKGNTITGNIAKPFSNTGWGYILEDSAGNNKVTNNMVLGGSNPVNRYNITQPNSTDLIIQ